MINFKNKKVTILGLGVSGFKSACLLKELGAQVFVSDKNDSSKLKKFCSDLDKLSIGFELGKHTKELIEESDYIVISPGVALDSEPLQWIRNKNIEVIGEMELGYQHCPAQIVAITGTNGKTTVTTLLGEVLRLSSRRVFVLGNIGEPLSGEVRKMQEYDLVSLEVSSFQLDAIQEFRPKVSVVLNVTPDHLNRYGNMQNYANAKKRIFLNQKQDDFVVLNKSLQGFADKAQARVLYFGNNPKEFLNFHVNENHLAVMKVAEIFGISPESCIDIFRTFKGIEHRMEFVRTIQGIDFVNDSKATNIDSTLWALNNITKPIVLIAGGRDKGSDFSVLRNIVKNKVRSLILFGEAKEKIRYSLSDIVNIQEVKDLNGSVTAAFCQAKEGDCILLSPMCASFDMFENYKERGALFKGIVNTLNA